MKRWKLTKQRLLAGLLCVVLVVTDTGLTGIQVLANEPETEVVKEDFYEDEVTTSSADMTETDTFEENTDTENTQQEEELSEAEGVVEEEELTGVYQFGGAPSKEDTEISLYSVNLASVDNAAELQEYIYQQLLARNTNIDIKEFNISWDDRSEVGSIVRAVINDHPELYFVESTISFSGTYAGSDAVIDSIKMTYNDFDDAAFKNETQKALATVKSGMSDLEKAIVLHDYLAVNCEYDKENLDANKVPDTSYTAYGVLVERIAVCQGYALAYKYLLNQVGIDCYMVTSDNMNHAWNLIKLNGNYYQVDVTWDDPTWDLIGRVRHQYMFRSDGAFKDECEHYDWWVTKGNEVVAYEATDTSYDSAFWLDCDAPLVLVGKDCYYVTYDSVKSTGVINKTTLSDITGTGDNICDIGKWTVWGANGNYLSAYSGLFQVNDRLYYNDKSSIYSIAPDSTEDNMDKRTEFTADTTNGYIYGIAFYQGKVLYSLRQMPNIASKETVLTADIMFEFEVEGIELDKSTVTMAKGETVELKATVTPSYAADATVTWASSDSSVAAVEDGVVTAVSEGNCTITASAGTHSAICNVTVTADRDTDEIAGGSYEDITWVIDKDGNLTVTGTGDFSVSTGFRRAPWYEKRASITSAEITVTGMTDASYMFYGCEKLTSLDMSGFDMGSVTDADNMLSGCSTLVTIDTPCNVKVSVELPMQSGYIWYQSNGTEITELPHNLSNSIKLSKNNAPVISNPYITAKKIKTIYECGDILDIDDLTVELHNADGTVIEVTGYSTNKDEIDMSTPGTKQLSITYNNLTASVELTVTETVKTDPDGETYTVTFDLQGHGTVLQEYLTYTEIEKGSMIKCPTSPQADGYEFTGWYKDADCQTLWDFEKDVVEENLTLYAGWKETEKTPDLDPDNQLKPRINSVLFPKSKDEYSAVYTGEQIRPVMIVAYQYKDDKGNAKTQKLKLNVDYTVYYSNNVNAGKNTAKVTVTGIGEYAGSITKEFTIERKSISGVTLSPVGDIVYGEKPSVVVTDGTHELAENEDYNVILSATGSAGADTPSVLTVEGIGNYTGTSKKSVQFNILKKGTDILSIADKSIHVEFKKFPTKGYTYNGKAIKPGVVVTDTTTGKKLSSSMYKVLYSNNVNAGKGTAKAWIVGISKDGKGYYGMSDPMYFDINQKDFNKVSVSLSGAIPKTGSIQDIKKSIDQAILVKDAKHVLSEDEYTIDYGNIKTVDDIKIGTTYQITLAPKADGNYRSDSKKESKIKFGQLNFASKTANILVKITDATQNEIEFSYNGVLLEKDKDYTATVKPEKNKGAYTVKIKAVSKSDYKGSRTIKNLSFNQDTEEGGSEDSKIPENSNAKPAVSNNKNTQNYRWFNNYNWNWADTVKSYLYENQAGYLTRVEYIDGKIVAEDYDNDFKLYKSREIPMELSIWGGFYAGAQYNFMIFGQENASQDDNAEVVRVVKYSKDWKRLGEVGLQGANTVVPFEAGSLRCTEYGDYLYIRTCHKMYASSDGLNHQANMTIAVRQSDMTITDSYYIVMNSNVGYVSHSFNQFVLVDQDQNLVTLDHGDAYPRGIVLMRPVNAKAGGDKFSGRFENSTLVTFPGSTGDNYTGASVGGFAETKNGYVTAFNYDGTGGKGSRAVYLGYTSKSELASQASPITEYDGMRTPVLAPAGLDGGFIMWTDSKDKFYYTEYEDGGTVGTINTADASLSDCQPILHNGEIVWYVTSKSVPTFFKLDVSSSKISKVVAK